MPPPLSADALATTPSEFASGLAALKVPYKVCTIISLAYRSIPDIARQFVDIRNSMQMRGAELSGKIPLHKKIKQYVLLLVPLIISTFARVGDIAKAMDLRGYGKKKQRSWYAEHELTPPGLHRPHLQRLLYHHAGQRQPDLSPAGLRH